MSTQTVQRHIVRPSVDDLQARLGLPSTEAARAIYGAITDLPEGDEIMRQLVGPTMTEQMIKLRKRLGPEIYREAEDKGLPLSQWLNREAPAPEFAGADTFEHLLADAEICVRHDVPSRIAADTIGQMRQKGADVGGGLKVGGVLLAELMNRAILNGQQWGTSWIQPSRRDFETINRFYASTSIISQLLQPELLKTQMVQTPIREATLLSRLVASTEVLAPGTDTWQQFYVDTSDAEAYSMRRVPEASWIPTVEILSGTGHTGRVYAYGRRVLFSYEVEQWSLPILQLHLSLFALQGNKDEESAIITMLINGDGNSGTAATEVDISTLSLGGAGSTTSIPAQGILQYLNTLEETAHYVRHDLAISRGIGKVLLQTADFGDSFTRLFWGDMPTRAGQAADAEALPHPPIFASADAPANKIMYVDSRQSIVRYVASGAPIVETDKIIGARMNEIVFWTKWGHQRLMPNTVDILDYAN